MKIKSETFSTRGSWAEYACLGKKRILDGDVIVLTWPNGSTERVRPEVRESSYQTSDMGTPCTIPTSKAFIKIEHNKAVIEVSLTHLKNVKGYFVTDVSDREDI